MSGSTAPAAPRRSRGCTSIRYRTARRRNLAGVLNALFGGLTGPTAVRRNSGVAPRSARRHRATGQRCRALGSSTARTGTGAAGARFDDRSGLARAPCRRPASERSAPAPWLRSALGTAVRIVGDDLNNAVLIYAPPGEFRKIEETLKAPRCAGDAGNDRGHHIEVTLRDEMQYGLQWYFTESKPRRHDAVGS